MKNKILKIYGVILIMVLFFSSCTDFLDMTPRDKKVVKTVEDHRDILASYMYFIKTTQRNQVTLFGVDAYASPYLDLSKVLSIYTGESSIKQNTSYLFNTITNTFTPIGSNLLTWKYPNTSVWEQYFKFLGPLNILIQDIQTAEGAGNEIHNFVLGEALVWRSYSYFKLLQYYSPYKNNEYGIPLYLNPSEDIGNAMPKRKTQSEVFAQLFSDCKWALELLDKTPTNEWNFAYRKDFVNAMMAEIYLWKAMSGAAEDSDWKNAKDYAEKAIGARKLAATSDDLKALFDCSEEALLSPKKSAEYFIKISDNKSLALQMRESYGTDGEFGTGIANEKYLSLFTDNDNRKSFYFAKEVDSTFNNNKYNFYSYGYDAPVGTLMPFRLADMYLIVAEAACRMNDVSKAITVMNTFRQSRYNNPSALNGGKNEILSEILKERTREFYLENDMIWLDMKRLGVTVTRNINEIQDVLKADDFRYTFPIPKREMETNKNMKQAPGWDKITF